MSKAKEIINLLEGKWNGKLELEEKYYVKYWKQIFSTLLKTMTVLNSKNHKISSKTEWEFLILNSFQDANFEDYKVTDGKVYQAKYYSLINDKKTFVPSMYGFTGVVGEIAIDNNDKIVDWWALKVEDKLVKSVSDMNLSSAKLLLKHYKGIEALYSKEYVPEFVTKSIDDIEATMRTLKK